MSNLLPGKPDESTNGDILAKNERLQSRHNIVTLIADGEKMLTEAKRSLSNSRMAATVAGDKPGDDPDVLYWHKQVDIVASGLSALRITLEKLRE